MEKKLVIITGPTGVGKTQAALLLAARINGSIINGDMGQLYKPLTIGTAKPDWQSSSIDHYGFDIIDTPSVYTVTRYRQQALEYCTTISNQGKIPIIVGGSSFYIQSLLFLPTAPTDNDNSYCAPIDENNKELWWSQLNEVDPERAQAIHCHDHYRLRRALAIWHTTGTKPSNYSLKFEPPANVCYVIHMTRERDQLYEHINSRVRTMLHEGWLKEVATLLDTPWEPFLHNKKIIGYDDCLRFLRQEQQGLEPSNELLEEHIAQKTRNYAKRQEIFWRRLEKMINTATTIAQSDDTTETFVKTSLANLTLLELDLYINQLSAQILTLS